MLAESSAPEPRAPVELPLPVPSPGPRPARWYLLIGEEQHGPFGLETMRRLVLSGVIDPSAYVWADGMPDWLRARDVPAITPPRSLRAGLGAWAAEAG